jgi:hypothetical protein
MTATDDLGTQFWTWRAAQQPRSHDDIPRIPRPAGWRPRWSAADVARYRAEIAVFEERLAALPPAADRAEEVDRRLLGSAFARVHWEMDGLRMWQTQPRFYVDQAIGAVFDLLTPPDPDAERIGRVVELLEGIPAVLAAGRENLSGHAIAEFARLAVDELAEIDTQVPEMADALAALPMAAAVTDRLRAAGRLAGTALTQFRNWVVAELPGMAPATPFGPEVYQRFLTDVALIPMTPEEILAIGRLELERAITLESLERQRGAASSAPGGAAAIPSVADRCAAEVAAERRVRRFLDERGLLSQPETLHHYVFRPLPDYLSPIRWLGVTDDLTDPQRVDQDGVSYLRQHEGVIPYFHAANIADPRTGIVHEGAHYQQLALSFRHPREIRRHYYDSGANEGIAFYNEEMTLAAGMFDDNPATRVTMYNFMRLRALRVEVDVRLAIGELDIPGAAAYLRDVVPMDEETAHEEAAFFAAYPGQAMTYQIGKTQILRLFSDAVRAAAARGDALDIRDFHDRLWREGNVPIALQRWELLDDDGDLVRLATLASEHSDRMEAVR